MYEQWSWDQNPVNLTCIATGIPNATITWWVRDREINREVIDRNMQVISKKNLPRKSKGKCNTWKNICSECHVLHLNSNVFKITFL